MGWTAGIIIFVISWWLIFFMVLPWGVQSQLESNSIEEGTEPGAPVKPRLLKKMGITTLATCIVLLIASVVIENNWLDPIFARDGANVWSGE